MSEPWWENLSPDEMRDMLGQALQIAPELEAPLRATLRARNGELDGVAAMVDDVLRTRRYLDWRQTGEYHDDAQPVLDLLDRQVQAHPTQELVELLQRAIKHVLAVIHRADDDGLIGSVLGHLYDLHVQACARSLPDQRKLATWLVKHTFDSNTFNPPDPVEYAGALGDKGIALYRRAVLKQLATATGPYSTELSHGRYAVERLAVIDRDPDAVIASYAHIERASWRELEIARALREIDRDDLALVHARAGLATDEPFNRSKLVELTAAILVDAGDLDSLHALRVADHDLRADRTSYSALREASTSLARWGADRPAAIVTLGRRNVRELVAVCWTRVASTRRGTPTVPRTVSCSGRRTTWRSWPHGPRTSGRRRRCLPRARRQGAPDQRPPALRAGDPLREEGGRAGEARRPHRGRRCARAWVARDAQAAPLAHPAPRSRQARPLTPNLVPIRALYDANRHEVASR